MSVLFEMNSRKLTSGVSTFVVFSVLALNDDVVAGEITDAKALKHALATF
jgi:hypothetical protein